MIIKYNKLVRSGIRQETINNNHRAVFANLTEPFLSLAVRDKIVEEALELKEDGTIDELADIYSLIEFASQKFGGIETIQAIAHLKTLKLGSFDEGLYLVYVETTDES